MTYKTILVHLDESARRAERLGLAFTLAERFDAHLVGLFAPPTDRIPSYARSEGGDALLQAIAQRRAAVEKEAKKEFEASRARRGAKSEWRASTDGSAAGLELHARYADLVIAGQPQRDGDETEPGFAGELVLSAGRPVLFVPYAGRFADVGKRVLVAWNAGREAARAVTDALPFLARAESVEVVAFDPERGGADHGEVPGADIGLFLARHGVKVTVARQRGIGIDIGSQILSRAADSSADLIVMGAYGHSRIRELVLGGATRELLEAMTVPVLMSH